MPADAQARLFQNIAEAMAGVPEAIIQRQLGHFYRADPAYSEGVARALGLSLKLEAAE